jgi:hypothetical protein
VRAPGQRAPRGATAVQEQAIMDLWERGESEQRIAETLGLPLYRVLRIRDYMRSDSKSDLQQTRRVIGESSAGLLTAIAAAYPERVPE